MKIAYFLNPHRKVLSKIPSFLIDVYKKKKYYLLPNNKVLRKTINLGIESLYDICDLEIINKNLIEPRLAWILVNVGLFVEEFKCKI